jgi:hypothetical protein
LHQAFDSIFQKFGKHEFPFGDPDETYTMFEIRPLSKTYGLRNIAYREHSDKMQTFLKD